MLFPSQVSQTVSLMDMRFTCSAVALSHSLAAVAAAAVADGAIVGLMSDEDRRVLAEFDTRRTGAIAGASARAEAAAGTTLGQVLAGQVLSFDDGYDPSGDWRCRSVKLGGDPAVAIDDWSSCRIFDDGAGWMIRKIDGRQRMMGRLYRLTGDRLLYLGARQDVDAAPIWFGEDPARDQMAVLTRLDDGRLRLEFPAPLAGSDFDILEFRR